MTRIISGHLSMVSQPECVVALIEAAFTRMLRGDIRYRFVIDMKATRR